MKRHRCHRRRTSTNPVVFLIDEVQTGIQARSAVIVVGDKPSPSTTCRLDARSMAPAFRRDVLQVVVIGVGIQGIAAAQRTTDRLALARLPNDAVTAAPRCMTPCGRCGRRTDP